MFFSFFRKKNGNQKPHANTSMQKTLNVQEQNVSPQELKDLVYDIIRNIRDPEKPQSLEDLHVVDEDSILVALQEQSNVIRVEFYPTVPHCSLATLIGLCIRIKLERTLPYKLKIDIFVKRGAHNTEEEINKQINDKERIAAAMENPNLKEMVEKCINEDDN